MMGQHYPNHLLLRPAAALVVALGGPSSGELEDLLLGDASGGELRATARGPEVDAWGSVLALP